MIKLSPNVFVAAVLGLGVLLFASLKFLPDANQVVQFVTLALAAVLRMKDADPAPVLISKEEKPDLKVIGGGLLLLAFLGFGPSACSATNVDRGVVSAGYAVELKDCLLKGKAVNDIDVYTKCADEVDVRFGLSVAKDGGK